LTSRSWGAHQNVRVGQIASAEARRCEAAIAEGKKLLATKGSGVVS